MSYGTLVAERRLHFEVDGTVGGYNNTGIGNGLVNVLSAANMGYLNGETPTIDVSVLSNMGSFHVYFLFPELVDLHDLIVRGASPSLHTLSISNLAGSPDTTNGIDGTWTAIGTSGTVLYSNAANDWWRTASVSPGSLTSNNTGLKGLRMTLTYSGSSSNNAIRNIMLWGHKTSGQTPDDLIFTEGDGSTERPDDHDYGDLLAGGSAVTETMYVKNVSGTKTASTIDLAVAGSDNGRVTISLDNATYASTRQIASLAAGATQILYVRFTPPSPGAGVYRPHACYVKATVSGGWA